MEGQSWNREPWNDAAIHGDRSLAPVRVCLFWRMFARTEGPWWNAMTDNLTGKEQAAGDNGCRIDLKEM
jgi:hypothetical protein